MNARPRYVLARGALKRLDAIPTVSRREDLHIQVPDHLQYEFPEILVDRVMEAALDLVHQQEPARWRMNGIHEGQGQVEQVDHPVAHGPKSDGL